MFGADKHPNACGGKSVVQCIGDLRGESLLHLQSSSEGINKAWNLREADDSAARHVANGGHAREREEVVFTEGVERDPLNHHKVASWSTRRLFEDGAENLVGVTGVTARQLEQGARDTAWGLHQPIACWILTDGAQDGTGGISNRRLSPWGGRNGNHRSPLRAHGYIVPAPRTPYGRVSRRVVAMMAVKAEGPFRRRESAGGTMAEIKHTSDAAFQKDVMESGRPVIVDFWAPWCGPCKLVAPELEKLAAQYDGKVEIVKVNVDENPALQQAFNIMSIPTIAYFKGAGAQPVGAVGFQTAEQLEARFALKELA